MPKKVRKLVVIQPLENPIGQDLTDAQRELTMQNSIFLNDFLTKLYGSFQSKLFSARTRCATATTYFTSIALGINDYVTTEALSSLDVHDSTPEDESELKKLLKSHQAKTDVLILVTHVGCAYDSRVFLTTTLERDFGWKIGQIMIKNQATVFEYTV